MGPIDVGAVAVAGKSVDHAIASSAGTSASVSVVFAGGAAAHPDRKVSLRDMVSGAYVEGGDPLLVEGQPDVSVRDGVLFLLHYVCDSGGEGYPLVGGWKHGIRVSGPVESVSPACAVGIVAVAKVAIKKLLPSGSNPVDHDDMDKRG